jgi:hypothetical protein
MSGLGARGSGLGRWFTWTVLIFGTMLSICCGASIEYRVFESLA